MSVTMSRAVRLMVLAASVAALAVLPPSLASAAARPSKSFIGILANDVSPYSSDTAYWDAQFAQMAKARVGVIRPTLDLARPSTTLDSFFIHAAVHHIRVMPLLMDSRKYVVPAGPLHGVYPPKRFGALARYANGLAKRYGRHGTLWSGPLRKYRRYAAHSWQVWNEPNLPVWWQPRPNPKAYVRMVKTVGRAIKRADVHAQIVSAGIPDSKQSKPRNYKRYLSAFLRAGGWRYVDAIGAHAYASKVSGVKRILRNYRRILNAHHGRRVHLLVSEVGWANRGHRNQMVVGARGQAARIHGLYRAAAKLRQRYRIDAIYYFDWRDYQAPAGDPRATTWGYHTGLLRANGTEKPAYRAFRTAVRRLLTPSKGRR